MRSAILLSLLGAGCNSAYTPDETLVHVDRPSHAVTTVASLDSCFARGGALVELGAVNNDDQADHGTLLTFGISPGGIVAEAGADGTLKFWTMDDTLLGTASAAVLTYGPEVSAAPITDLAFDGDHAIAGDVRGLVSSLSSDGRTTIMGGTVPDVPIASVAFDPSAHVLAHAQRGEGATPLVVQSVDGTRNANVEDTLPTITDLAFTVDGALVVGGQNDALHAAVEIRGSSDPTTVSAHIELGTDARVIEVAAAREGSAIVAITVRGLYAIDGTRATLLASSDVDLRSVELSPSGDHAYVVDANGRLSVRATVDGHELASIAVPSGFAVRVDGEDQRIVVGATDAMLHVLSCQ